MLKNPVAFAFASLLGLSGCNYASEGDVDGTKKDVNDVEARVAALETLVAQQAATIATLQANLSAAESVNTAQTTDLADDEGRLTTLEGGLTQALAELTALDTRVDDAETGLALAETGIDTLDTRADTADSDIDSLETAVAARATTTALNALTTRVTTAESDIDSLTPAVTTLISDVNNVESDVTDLDTRTTDLEDWGTCDWDLILRPNGVSIDSNLLGYWRLGASGADSSGDGNTLTMNGVTRTAGVGNDGNAATYFDTSTDRATRASMPMSSVAFTVSAFFRTDDPGNRFFFSYASSDTDDNDILLGLNGGQLDVTIKNTAIPQLVGNDLDDGNWHHAAVTWTSLGSVAVYVDGVQMYLAGSGVASGSLVTGGTLVLGEEQDTLGGTFDPDQAWVGSLDEVSVYSYPMTANEVLNIYRTIRCGGS